MTTTYAEVQQHHLDIAMLLATDPRRLSDWELFVRTLYADWVTHGQISQDRVRLVLLYADGRTITPSAYSGMWARARKGKKTEPDSHPPLIKTVDWETCTTSLSGNNGKLQRIDEWIGPKP